MRANPSLGFLLGLLVVACSGGGGGSGFSPSGTGTVIQTVAILDFLIENADLFQNS